MHTMKLYPYNTILFFHHIFVLHYNTKTHTLIFYLIPVLKVLKRQAYSTVSVFFVSIANRYSVKSFIA